MNFKEMNQFWLIVAILLLSLIRNSYQLLPTINYIQRGADEVLFNSIVATHQNSSRAYCGDLCFFTPGCFAFDFHRSSALCVLHDGGLIGMSTPLEVSPGEEDVRTYAPQDHLCGAVGCYRFHSGTMSREDAMAYCAERKMTLVAVEDQAEMGELAGLAVHAGMGTGLSYWTSGSDIATEGTFVWESTGEVLASGLKWKPNEPNNSGGNEDCIHIHLTDGMNDLTCATGLQSVICEHRLL